MSDQINQEDQIPEIKKTKFFKSTKVKIILSVVIVLFTVVTIKGIAFAKHFHKLHDGPDGFIIEHLVKNLNLTEVQKAQVERIRDQIKEKMEANKPDRKNDMDDFANEFRKDKMDKNTLKEIHQKNEKKHEEMKEFMLDKLIEFHDILTPDQRNKAIENMKDMKMKFHEGRDKFKDGPRKPGNFEKKND